MIDTLDILSTCIAQGLLHSLWQSVVLYGVYVLLMHITKKSASVYRYWISISVYAVAVLLWFVTISGVIHAALMQQSTSNHLSFTLSTMEEVRIIAPNPVVEFFSTLITSVGSWLPIVSLLWIGGFSLLLIRFIRALQTIRHLYATMSPLSPEKTDAVQRTRLLMGVTKDVLIFTSWHVPSPVTFGFFKPVIVVATEDNSFYTTSTMQSLLMHEFAHIKRYDYAINCIQTIVDAVFFFNPLLKDISNRIRKERELCCDEMVLHAGVNPIAYARTLTDLYSNDLSMNLSMGITGGLLSYRVMKLLTPAQRPNKGVCILFLLLSIFLITGILDSSRTQYYTVEGIDYTIEQFQSFKNNNLRFK